MTHPTLATWLDEEAAVRARVDAGPGPGLADPRQIAQLSGLEWMQAMLDGKIPYASIARTLDFMLIEVSTGHAVFQGHPGSDHLNPMGTVHGGWYATLLDSALGCAVHSSLPAGRAYTTAELGINLVKAILPGKVSRVRAIGEVVHSGRQMATAQARLLGPDGTLYAHASTTCPVFDARH